MSSQPGIRLIETETRDSKVAFYPSVRSASSVLKQRTLSSDKLVETCYHIKLSEKADKAERAN